MRQPALNGTSTFTLEAAVGDEEDEGIDDEEGASHCKIYGQWESDALRCGQKGFTPKISG
ncbi:unnamed protein product [Lepidochelys kempii]